MSASELAATTTFAKLAPKPATARSVVALAKLVGVSVSTHACHDPEEAGGDLQ
jgi:hypothetical protein